MTIVMLIVALPAIFATQFIVPRLMPFVERFARKTIGLVREAWQFARWYEKVGLVIFCFGWLIPGPLDEILGMLLIARIIKRGRQAVRPAWIYEQVAEDTCSTHGIFCCSQCFDMEPVA